MAVHHIVTILLIVLSWNYNAVRIGSLVICIHDPVDYIMAVCIQINLIRILQVPMQSVPITTKVASSNPAHGEVYSMQHYMIKFVSNLRQVRGFLLVLRFPPPIKLTTTYN